MKEVQPVMQQLDVSCHVAGNLVMSTQHVNPITTNTTNGPMVFHKPIRIYKFIYTYIYGGLILDVILLLLFEWGI